MAFRTVLLVLALVAGCTNALVSPTRFQLRHAQSNRRSGAPNMIIKAFRSKKTQAASAATADAISSPESVDKATMHWCKTVTSGAEDNWKRVSDLYAPDALLWGTVSEDLRGKQDLIDYFKYFAMIPGLSLKEGSYKSDVQVLGEDTAINSGYYTFVIPQKDGEDKAVPARFTFVYRKRDEPKDGIKWEIVNHHSSAIPSQPESLTPILAKQ